MFNLIINRLRFQFNYNQVTHLRVKNVLVFHNFSMFEWKKKDIVFEFLFMQQYVYISKSQLKTFIFRVIFSVYISNGRIIFSVF